MHPVKQKSIQRQENILLSLNKLDYLTITQIQRLHNLKSYNNAYRVMKQLEPYMGVFKDEGVNVYYLNKKGREYVNSTKERTKLTTVKHYLMRNDLYIHSGCPNSWKNEVEMISGANTSKEIKVIADAHYTHNNRHFIIEIDNLQKMKKNKVKIDKYRRLIERNSFKGMPKLIWVTTSPYRQKQLRKLCEGLDAYVFLNTDIGG